jgi:hypothetical protein
MVSRREREEAEHNEWRASRGFSALPPSKAPKEYWPLPGWAAVLLRVGAGLLGLIGAMGLWIVAKQLMSTDYSLGWIPPLLTAVAFLIPLAGVCWLALWMRSRAFAGWDSMRGRG